MKGSCLCGQCSFEIEGDPGPVGKCHCTKCQKVSGAGSNAVFWIPSSRFSWTSGENCAKTFRLNDGWSSVFCESCGSPLPTSIGEKFWAVPAGLIDDDVQVDVRGHIWVDSKPHWEIIGDDAPQFDQNPPR